MYYLGVILNLIAFLDNTKPLTPQALCVKLGV